MQFSKGYRELKKLFPKANYKKIFSLLKLKEEQNLVSQLTMLSLIIGITLLVMTFMIIYK